MKNFLFLFLIFALLPVSVSAQMSRDLQEPPIDIKELQSIERETKKLEDEENNLPLDIRNDAQKDAAISYGARGGLVWRTWHIRRETETRARYLDKVFDFRQLLIPAPSGTLIEPPVVSEAMDALLISNRGEQAALADKILRINRNARIVSAPRTWRFYLEREWGVVEPPPDLLRPDSAEERRDWEEWIDEGWVLGVEQADETFQDDLNRLVADYQGMVRYQLLLRQGMITPPYALQVDRGVTGNGNEMRIGDRAVEITDMPRLQTGYEKWQPANR
ncbi:MAG: type IV secretory system conjugative DNA transfer family protein [Pseudomonadota bacterium]